MESEYLCLGDCSIIYYKITLIFVHWAGLLSHFFTLKS
jgi:hypothetical protein